MLSRPSDPLLSALPAMNTDQIITLVMFVVIRSDDLNLHTNLNYMRHFSYEHDIDTGQIGHISIYHFILGYSLSCFEAVIQYLSENSVTLKVLSDKNKKLWESINEDSFVGFRNSVENVALTLESPIKANFDEKNECENNYESLLSRNEAGDNSILIAAELGNLDIIKLRISFQFLTDCSS